MDSLSGGYRTFHASGYDHPPKNGKSSTEYSAEHHPFNHGEVSSLKGTILMESYGEIHHPTSTLQAQLLRGNVRTPENKQPP